MPKWSVVLCILLTFGAVACSESDSHVDAAICGDNVKNGDEVCDGEDGLVTCSEFDSTKTWLPGGKTQCSSDCAKILQGTCEETHPMAICGDNVKNGDEVCDGEDGLVTCSEFDSTKTWLPGGKTQCSTDCTKILQGTCEETQPMAICGDNVKNGNEVCDGEDGLVTCSEFDSTKTWLPGGKTQCSSDCAKILQGTCEETQPMAICGDNVKNGDEVCDGEDGLVTCGEFDSTKNWLEGGKTQCSPDCTKILQGTCEAYVTFMNWNILFEYYHNNGELADGWAAVDKRADKLVEILKSYRVLPDFIAVAEASPLWHSEANTKKFESLGYVWANNEISPSGRAPLSNIFYREALYTQLETGIVNLVDTNDVAIDMDKTIVLYSVLEDKQSQRQFLILATHWDANNIGADTQGLNSSFSNGVYWVVKHELNRVMSARQSAETIAALRQKYPKAHVIYGGDFNTIDFNILFTSSVADYLKLLSVTDVPSLIVFVNNMLKTTDTSLPEDFVGSHRELILKSGLSDARTYALEHKIIPATEDRITTMPNVSDDLKTLIETINVPLIIDYAVFSADNLRLIDYKVMSDGDAFGNTMEDYRYVSDHFPVQTQYVMGATQAVREADEE